jgi:hypothetical protein
MRLLVTAVLAVAGPAALPGAVFTNSASADSFVRGAAPDSNYGGAGALSVSGASAVNGVNVANGAFDTFIRFNTAAMVTNFNSLFGSDSWAVTGSTLQVTEVGAPGNAIFNRGTGSFQIRWIANDNWTEGTGTPSGPGTSGIVYTNEASLLNPTTDAVLGTFTNAGVDGVLSFPLTLPAPFVSDLVAGGEVGLFLTPIDPGIGFTFDSRSFGVLSAHPYLGVSAAPRPVIASLTVSGADLVLVVTNAEAGTTCTVLSSPDVTNPPSQWLALTTNQVTADGPFSITLTNAASDPTQPPQFLRLLAR